MAIGQGHISQKFVTGLVIEPSANDQSIIIDISEFSRLNIFLRMTYPQTSPTTGITVDQYYGMQDPGMADGTFMFADNFDTIGSLIQVPSNQSSQQQTLSEWDAAVQVLPRGLMLSITNNDGTHPVTIDCWGDLF